MLIIIMLILVAILILDKSVQEIITALNEIVTAEYIIDNDVTSTTIRGNINKNIVQVIADVEKYNDGNQHTLTIHLTDEFGNKWEEHANFSYTNE